MISSRLATYHELNTVYGPEAMYDLLEVIAVDAHNMAIVRARNAKG